MRAGIAAAFVILAGLGLQLAMVVGVIAPNLLLAFLGYGGLFAGMMMLVPAALRRAQADRAFRRQRRPDA